MSGLKREVVHTINRDDLQDFIECNEINNQIYIIYPNKKIDFLFEDWDYTDLTYTEILNHQSKLSYDEVGVILPSEANIEKHMYEYGF